MLNMHQDFHCVVLLGRGLSTLELILLISGTVRATISWKHILLHQKTLLGRIGLDIENLLNNILIQ